MRSGQNAPSRVAHTSICKASPRQVRPDCNEPSCAISCSARAVTQVPPRASLDDCSAASQCYTSRQHAKFEKVYLLPRLKRTDCTDISRCSSTTSTSPGDSRVNPVYETQLRATENHLYLATILAGTYFLLCTLTLARLSTYFCASRKHCGGVSSSSGRPERARQLRVLFMHLASEKLNSCRQAPSVFHLY
jgi:hypothetical protein